MRIGIKDYNNSLVAYFGVKQVIRDIKTFNILSYRYRKKRIRHVIKFKIIAEFVNLKNKFKAAQTKAVAR